jgi:FG-GAP repeat/CARDB
MDSKCISFIKRATLRTTSAARHRLVISFIALGVLAGTSGAHAATLRADFNKDGYDDLVVGVPNESISGDTSAGAVHVIYGSATGLTEFGDQLWFQDLSGIVRELSEPGDQFGASLAAGDFNNDGFPDLAIGAPGESLGVNNSIDRAGVVHVLFGSPAGLTDLNDQVWDQDSPGVFSAPTRLTYFGNALAAGDFDHDGFADLAIGARGQLVADKYAGGVQILRGSASGLITTGAEFLTADGLLSPGQSQDFDYFGDALTTGDFNADGFADLAIGEPGATVQDPNGPDLSDAGQAFVVFGSANGLNSETSPRMQMIRQGAGFFQGVAEVGDRLGSALAAGDFNHDGRDDLAVGAPDEDVGSVVNAGAVNVIYGSSSGLSVIGNQLWYQDVTGIADVSETGDSFGRSLAVGDFNGDGFDDLAVGVPHEDFPGIVAGDIDTSAGAVNVIYGTIQGLTAANNQLWDQNASNIEDVREDLDFFGTTLAAGDFNGDSRDDLAIGVPNEDIGSITDAGAVNVIYGTARTGLNAGGIFPGERTDQLWHQDVFGVLDNAEAFDRFGFALASRLSSSLFSTGVSGEWIKVKQACGETCRIHGQFDVSNPGMTTTARESIVQFFLSSDQTLDDADTLLGEVVVPAIDAGDSVNVKVNLALVQGQNAQGYFVIAVVDATDVVPEFNEKNNIIVSAPIE